MSNEFETLDKSNELPSSSDASAEKAQQKLHEDAYSADTTIAPAAVKDAPAATTPVVADSTVQGTTLIQQALSSVLSGNSAAGMTELMAAAQLDPALRDDPRFQAALQTALNKQSSGATQV